MKVTDRPACAQVDLSFTSDNRRPYCDGRTLIVPARPPAAEVRSTQVTLREPGNRRWLTLPVDPAACSAGSAWFAAMTKSGAFQEASTHDWDVQDVDCAAAHAVWRYLHGETNRFDRDDLVSVYVLADRWQVEALTSACKQAVSEQVDAQSLGNLWAQVETAKEAASALRDSLSRTAWALRLPSPTQTLAVTEPSSETFVVRTQQVDAKVRTIKGRWFVPECLVSLSDGLSPTWDGPDMSLRLRRTISEDSLCASFNLEGASYFTSFDYSTTYKAGGAIVQELAVGSECVGSSFHETHDVEFSPRADESTPWHFDFVLTKFDLDGAELSDRTPFSAKGHQDFAFEVNFVAGHRRKARPQSGVHWALTTADDRSQESGAPFFPGQF